MPKDVTEIYISGCAAGGQGSPTGKHDDQTGGKAGQYVFKYRMYVEPKQKIPITVGMGNTIVNDLVLLANYTNESYENDFIGYKTGKAGTNGEAYSGHVASGGAGGAFRFGGGGGGLDYVKTSTTTRYIGEKGDTYKGGNGKGEKHNHPGGEGAFFNKMPPYQTYENAGYVESHTNGDYAYIGKPGGGGGGYGAGGGANGYNGNSYGGSMEGPGGSPGIVIVEW